MRKPTIVGGLLTAGFIALSFSIIRAATASASHFTTHVTGTASSVTWTAIACNFEDALVNQSLRIMPRPRHADGSLLTEAPTSQPSNEKMVAVNTNEVSEPREDQRAPTSPGGRIIHASQKSGTTLGAQIAASFLELGSDPGVVVVESGGAINQQITIGSNQKLHFMGGGGTITSTARDAYILMKDHSSLECDSYNWVLQETSHAGIFRTVRDFNGSVDGRDKAVGLTIRGCRFQGLGKKGDGAQGAISFGNVQQTVIDRVWIDSPSAIGINIGGAPPSVVARSGAIHGWKGVNVSSIAASTINAVPVGVITTATAHEFSPGDRVIVFDAPSNTGLSPHRYERRTFGSWFVNDTTSTTLTITSLTPTGCRSGCAGASVHLANSARSTQVANSIFTDTNSAGVALACVNCFNVTFEGNTFRRQINGGVFIDVEPNGWFEANSGITISNNVMDFRGSKYVGNVSSSGIVWQWAKVPQSGSGSIVNNTIIGSSIQKGRSTQMDQYSMSVGIDVTDLDDVNVSTNTIVGAYQACLKITGSRNLIANNICTGGPTGGGRVIQDSSPGGASDRGLTYSVIRGNVAQVRDHSGTSILGTASTTTTIDETLSGTSGHNEYDGNVGIDVYELARTSFLRSGGKGGNVAAATSISPTGTSFTLTGTTTVHTIAATGVTPGTTLNIITSAAVTFSNTGNMTFNGGATSLRTVPNDLVIATWDGFKWRVR